MTPPPPFKDLAGAKSSMMETKMHNIFLFKLAFGAGININNGVQLYFSLLLYYKRTEKNYLLILHTNSNLKSAFLHVRNLQEVFLRAISLWNDMVEKQSKDSVENSKKQFAVEHREL